MSSVHETAYPRLKLEFTEQELIAIYTPTPAELKYVASQYRQISQQAYLLIQLKLLQRLGYFVALASVPAVVIEHICSRAQLRIPAQAALTRYDQSGTRYRHHVRLREYVGIRVLDKAAEKWLQEQALQAAQTKQELPDIINVLIEELIQRRYELPGFTHLFRLARSSRATINDRIYKAIAGALPEAVIARLGRLLETGPGRSVWDSLKREPKQPNVREVTDFLQHIDAMIGLAENLPDTEHIAATKREQLVLEARALDLAEMRALKPLKRYTLAVLLIQTQLQKAMDDVAEIFIKTIRNLHNVAEERLRQYHLQQAEQVERLIGQFREVLTVFSEDGTNDQRVARVEKSLDGDLESWITECDEHMAYAGNNYYPFMLAGYAGKRSLLFKCLEALTLRSSSQDDSLLRTVTLVQKYRSSHREHLSIAETGLDTLALDWMPDKWRNLVLGKRQSTAPTHFHRKYFELTVFSEVMDELKSGDLYVEHSGDYDDYRNHLVSWEEYEQEVQGYGELVGLPVEAEAFVSELRDRLRTQAREVDKRFPENGHVDIDDTGIVIRRAERQKPPAELEAVDEAIRSQLTDASILDVLTETEKWLDLHKLFGPLSGFESKVDDPRKRFITTLFCYGCNLGPTQTARSVKGLSRKQVAWLNLKHVTEQRLDKAIVKVINAYNRFALPRYWGTGKSASADGTKWNMYEQNLLSEYHIRYGGYGGIGYYHVSDKYIALFSHFIPCGVYEAVYILDGLINNQSDIQPDTLHGDTQAQSTPVFGLAHLLGINLMPRIRNIKDLVFYRADRADQYEHIGSLFRGTIDWALIGRHLKDMLRVVISIKAGKIAPSTILRRLGTASRKNKLYYAFRELGRVIRTQFLLKYINDAELRKTINAATVKSEEFNDFVKWLFFGGDGIISENIRHEQRKVVKYNHLVANMVILHNVHGMSRILKELQAKGYVLTEEILRSTAPYRREHINRFGEYPLDLDREVEPINYKIDFAI
ncbi:MAG: Tn3 family transposase [Herbaspirillum sp.]|jgi:TnpA family transposase|uniref:Tn3 family transposase n=1 Tax=Herbaspirillum sp. TaxID=1890675 RepID=UPI002589DF53|nr:Tn3 family transposase [Herbaspirillum sp.]MCP3656695.1 Tn3 family transposase [Herbaspirillum sp.]MCP3950449.1 Tn3 family transposase [Herbaspirillum sp.]MCP4030983.1 Tn3 family transposase [Herbaspirillum sp.]